MSDEKRSGDQSANTENAEAWREANRRETERRERTERERGKPWPPATREGGA